MLLTIHLCQGSLCFFLSSEGDESVALGSAGGVIPHDARIRAARTCASKGLKKKSVGDLHRQAHVSRLRQ